jgi:UDP-N-acetylglucosamine diphosphorylase/glucosamine-1-phosphate N-acetyltransferase
MTQNICLFEDNQFDHLLPLTYFRPVYDLRCGILTLREKVQRQYTGLPVSLHCRSYLAGALQERSPGTPVNAINSAATLFINGRVIVDDQLASAITPQGEDVVFSAGEVVIAARVSGERHTRICRTLSQVFTPETFAGLPRKEVTATVITYPWDLVHANGPQIEADFTLLAQAGDRGLKGTIYDGTHLLNKEGIFVAEGAKVKPGVVLDAENGPIYIGKNTTIFPNATIEGPAFVGENSLIKIGAKIYENTSVGPMCKVGGEVEESVIHSYSNKQHDGFLGHAYLGMWVNLGADTNNSDLKNNYGNVKVVINGRLVDSGSMFVGLTMGDHSKSGINTMFNTGTVVGVSSNVFGAGFPPKFVPSFSWGGSDGQETYELEKSLAVARRVMARRKVTLSAAEESLFRTVFELTRWEREPAVKAR